MNKERLLQSLKIAMRKTRKRRAAYIREKQIFGYFGNNSLYCPFLLPLYPKLIKIHDNVFIHRTAQLVPHDMLNSFLRKTYLGEDFGHVERIGCIEIMDNVYVSMNSIIMPNVRINKNCIITAGTVVTHDIPENSIVAGNPGRVVGRLDQYAAMRKIDKDQNIRFRNQHLPDELALQKWVAFDLEHASADSHELVYADQVGDSLASQSSKQTLSPKEENIKNTIVSILSSQIDGVDVSLEEHLIDHHILDSLSMMMVVSTLEETFRCKIPFTQINAVNFNSVIGMTKLVSGLSKTDSKNEVGADNTTDDAEPADTADHAKASANNAVVPFLDVHSLVPLPLNLDDTEKPVVQRIMEHALTNPAAPAIIANDKVTSYSELASMIYSIYHWMINNHAAGSDEGLKDCCIVVQAIHEDTCIAAYYAVHLAGAKLVPVEKTATPQRILEIAKETQASLIIALDPYRPNDISSAPLLPEMASASVPSTDTTAVPWVEYETVRSIAHDLAFESSSPITYPDIDLPCEMIFTTGTTGKSKGVLMTHRHDSWYSYSLAKRIEMKENNRFLLTTPLNHAGGLRRTHLSLANGCCMVYLDGLSDLGKYFEYIEKYQVTSLYLPPVAIRILLARTGNELGKYKDQIDFVYSSSSPLPDSDCQELSKLLPNTRLYNAYEASETPGVSAYDYNTAAPLKGCLGPANDGVDLAIMLEDGSITKEPNIQGQICVKSHMNMAGYYHEPELTKSVLKEDWFISSDLGILDTEGNIYYNGRLGDVINIGGYKIAPTDVEEVALASGQINDCICIEDLDEYKVPYLKLLVVTDDPASFDTNALTQYISAKLEAYKVPRKIECVEEIHKTFNGKKDRKAYR